MESRTTSSSTGAAPTSLLRLKEVLQRTGLTKTILYSKVKARTFPPQIPLTDRTVAWDSRDIDEWIRNRIAGARPAVQNHDGGVQ